VAGFHSRTVPSLPALASSLPSGLNATAHTVDGPTGSMPCCCCSASRVVMAAMAVLWLTATIHHSLLAKTGLPQQPARHGPRPVGAH